MAAQKKNFCEGAKCISKGAKIQKFAKNGWFWPFFFLRMGGEEGQSVRLEGPMPPHAPRDVTTDDRYGYEQAKIWFFVCSTQGHQFLFFLFNTCFFNFDLILFNCSIKVCFYEHNFWHVQLLFCVFRKITADHQPVVEAETTADQDRIDQEFMCHRSHCLL